MHKSAPITATLGVVCVTAILVVGQAGAVAADAFARPVLSRTDIATLKRSDRARVFAALGSFDARGLPEDEFIWRTTDLLDAARIPGLAEARVARDSSDALNCIVRACAALCAESTKRTADSGTVTEANDTLANRFSFYGEAYQLPDNIDWDFNPGTAHWGHDLNRFTYLSPLTRAYLATGDPRYSRKAVGLMLDWIDKYDAGQCFQGTPYVWGSYLNNAIHCQAWCRCLAIMLAHEQITPSELLRVLKSLHDQLAYLEIVTNGHAGNWPTIGCQGMLACLATFPVFRDTNRFTEYCLGSLKSQIAEQVLPDGVQDELTPHYHRVVVNNLLTAIRSLRAMQRELDPETMATLGKMVHYVQQTSVPDGSKQVAFNDSDPGAGTAIPESLASLGLQGLLSPPERIGPEVFPYAGVALLRQRADQGDLYLAFDAGPYGRSHQHEDRLGLWLFAYGRNLLVDPGRHLYDTSARSYYPYLKSTVAHSTIRIDGQNQHSAGRREMWIAKQPLDLHWRQHNGEVRASGCYDLGYGPKNQIDVTHRREIVFVQQRFWVVFDVVQGQGPHLVESRFQFAPGSLVVDGTVARTKYDDANLLLHAVSETPMAAAHVEQGQENPRGGWYSDSYGKIEPAPAFVLSVHTTLPWHAATLLFPSRGPKPPEAAFHFQGGEAQIHCAELGAVRVKCSLPE